MYLLREQWIGVFINRFFAVGMTTTSHSESMNAKFDSYVNPTMVMTDFAVQMQRALEKQIDREAKEEYKSI